MNSIKRLESLPGMIAADKASILMVYGNLKPSATVVTEGEIFPLSEEPCHVDAKLVDEIDAILSGLGLEYTTETIVYENSSGKSYDHGQEVMRICVAHDKDTAVELCGYFGDIEKNHEAAGLLLGYPATAVKAFLTPDMLDMDQHPDATDEVSETNMMLLGHRLSKQHWREEVKYLEPSGNYLKLVSPMLYAQVTT